MWVFPGLRAAVRLLYLLHVHVFFYFLEFLSPRRLRCHVLRKPLCLSVSLSLCLSVSLLFWKHVFLCTLGSVQRSADSAEETAVTLAEMEFLICFKSDLQRKSSSLRTRPRNNRITTAGLVLAFQLWDIICRAECAECKCPEARYNMRRRSDQVLYTLLCLLGSVAVRLHKTTRVAPR